MKGKPTICPTFGQSLRAAREKAKLSQGELATRAGVSEQCIYLWEHDRRRPSLALYVQLLAGLGITQALPLVAE